MAAHTRPAASGSQPRTTSEQFKHLAAAEAGPLAGLAVPPGLRALRPQLAAIADRTDPLEMQRMFASAMLAADPVSSGVYYVDDHFVPYTGAKPVGKGWNNKRGRAEKGRADTHPGGKLLTRSWWAIVLPGASGVALQPSAGAIGTHSRQCPGAHAGRGGAAVSSVVSG
jgi:hypothetical protein